MKSINENASREEIIKVINDLIAACNAIAKTISNLSAGTRFIEVVQKIDELERKVIKQGDLIVGYIAELREPKNLG